MSRQVILTNLAFHKLPTCLSCVQYPLWFRVRDYKNQRIDKQKSYREKHKHMQGHSKSILKTSYRFGHLKKCAKMNKSVIVLKIYSCAFRAFQQTKLISLRENPINSDQKHFAAVYWKNKNKKNKKNVIANKDILKNWIHLSFALFFFFFFFSKKADLRLYLYICERRFLDSYINVNRTKIFSIYSKILFKKNQFENL